MWSCRLDGSWLSRLPFTGLEFEIRQNRNSMVLQVCRDDQSRYLPNSWAGRIHLEISCVKKMPWIKPGDITPKEFPIEISRVQVLHLLRWVRTRTHTPQEGGRMRCKWQCLKWRIFNRDTKRGTQKKREGANTKTTHLAQSGQTLKGQKKRKAEADGHGTRPAEGGRTEAPEPTYQSKTYAYLSTHRTQPTCRREK